MNKRKSLFLITACLAIAGLGGVSAQQAILASGGDAAGNGGTVHYSVGHLFFRSVTGTTGSVTPFVQQPFEFVTVGTERNNAISLSALVYPNPTHSRIILRVENLKRQKLSFLLCDLSGRLMLRQPLTDPETTIPMEALGAGAYLLTVTDPTSVVKTFKIIKK